MDYLILVVAGIVSLLFSFNIAKTSKSLIYISISAFIIGSLVNLFIFGLNSLLLSSSIALALFIVLFFTGLLSRKTTFLFPALFAFLPLGLWWAFIPGFIINSLVSVFKIAKSTGLKDVGSTATTAYINTKYGKVEDIRTMMEAPTKETKVNFFIWNALGLLLYAGFIYIF